jgi:asparagine synthase (glutamine-hydrolysing)
MCGITGIYCFNDTADKYSDRLAMAVDSLKYRGPDDNGIYIDKNTGFGHTRLSIIDVSTAGAQPFADISGKYSLVFNGEFYNHKDFKQELLNDGVKFKSSSDTEVLLYLLIKYGSDAIEKVNGCFSFAFYDSVNNSCIIARDRMGINPLVYFKDNEKLVFASELKALIAFGIPRELNTSAVFTYFQLNYLPTNTSILKNVYKLEPGYYLSITKQGVVKNQYYKIHEFDSKAPTTSYNDAKIKLRELLDASVKRRLVADVPLGCFLSGGIDSTIITALAAGHTKHVNTFSIGFKGDSYFDETSFAELVAKKYNTNHTSFKVSKDDLLQNLNIVLDYLDEPFADSSALAVNILSKLTREKATVALSGDGADEMFAGYNKHTAHFNATYAGTKEKVAAAMNPLWKVVPKSRNSKAANFARQLDRFASGYKLSPEERYWFWASIGTEKYVNDLLNIKIDYQQFSKNKLSILSTKNSFSEINTILYADMHLVLQGDMLAKVDFMSMANSLEVRTPFLDHTVVDFVFSLPSHYKITANTRKRILKDCCADLIPEDLIHRTKHGFEVPLLSWFRNELWSMIDNDLLSEKFVREQEIFNYETVKKLKKKIFSNNPEDSAAKIWALLVFQYWWKKYFN